jgi:hypothetical protein
MKLQKVGISMNDKIKLIVAISMMVITFFMLVPRLGSSRNLTPMEQAIEYIDDQETFDAETLETASIMVEDGVSDIISENYVPYNFDASFYVSEFDTSLYNIEAYVIRVDLYSIYGQFDIYEENYEYHVWEFEEYAWILSENLTFLELNPNEYVLEVYIHGNSDTGILEYKYTFNYYEDVRGLDVSYTSENDNLSLVLFDMGPNIYNVLGSGYGDNTSFLIETSDEVLCLYMKIYYSKPAVYYNLSMSDSLIVENYLNDLFENELNYYPISMIERNLN